MLTTPKLYAATVISSTKWMPSSCNHLYELPIYNLSEALLPRWPHLLFPWIILESRFQLHGMCSLKVTSKPSTHPLRKTESWSLLQFTTLNLFGLSPSEHRIFLSLIRPIYSLFSHLVPPSIPCCVQGLLQVLFISLSIPHAADDLFFTVHVVGTGTSYGGCLQCMTLSEWWVRATSTSFQLSSFAVVNSS